MPRFEIHPKFNDKIKPSDIETMLKKFQNVNYDVDNYDEYASLVIKYLMSTNLRSNAFIMYNGTITFPKGNKFFRTRAMDYDDILKISDTSQFWSPPSKYVRWGRLNKPNKPVLYASQECSTAIIENKEIKNDYLLIEYEIIDPVICQHISKMMSPITEVRRPETNGELFDKIDTFLVDLLSYNGNSTNYYKFTNGIVNKLYKDFSKNKDGYYYPSAVDDGKYNVALKVDIENIKLIVNRVTARELTEDGFRINKVIYTKEKGFI